MCHLLLVLIFLRALMQCYALSHLLCELEGFVSFCVSMIVLTLMSAYKGGFNCDVTPIVSISVWV